MTPVTYIWFMDIKPNGEAAPGVADQDVPDVAKVTEWLKNDLARAIACLEAMYKDPDLLVHLAQFMHGRYSNFRESQKLKEGRK